MPTTSAELIEHIASNPVFIAPIWSITSRDGLTAGYCAHSRATVGRLHNPVSLFEFEGVIYKPASVQTTRDLHRIGLTPNSTQIIGVFDDVITRADVEAGRWKLAKIAYCYVCYLDLSLGATGKISGYAGRWDINNPSYSVEFLSNAALLQQQIGDLTSPTDRNAFPAGLDKADWTITRNVDTSDDRRHVVVDGATLEDHFYQYGVLKTTSGANQNSPGMEIKDNIGNTIELQLPMPANFAHGDTVTLLAGYDGTRRQARDKFSAMEDFDGEPDLPGLNEILSYPE